jgi:hypothetical protein
VEYIDETAWHDGCTPLTGRVVSSMGKNRIIRRILVVIATFKPFLIVAFSRDGLLSRDGRTLIRGKFRRIFFSSIPPLARFMQKRYGMKGGCQSCGASCNLLFQCPHWNATTRLCGVYEDRPNICRLFPITPSDIRDRSIVQKNVSCGFQFAGKTEPVTETKPTKGIPALAVTRLSNTPRNDIE